MSKPTGSKTHYQLGKWHSLSTNYDGLNRYWEIPEYIRGWDDGSKIWRLQLLLEHGSMSAQQQFKHRYAKYYE